MYGPSTESPAELGSAEHAMQGIFIESASQDEEKDVDEWNPPVI
jgi:hypothetical protein